MTAMIEKKKLVVGECYVGRCRNAYVAQWTGKKFVYIRSKFGNLFLEEINHPEDDDGYDLFVPVRKIRGLTNKEALGVGDIIRELNDKAKK